jgi:hypothetical protein
MMFRRKWIPTLAGLGLCALVAGPATAAPFTSFYVSGAVGGQSQEVTLDAAGLQSYDGTSGVLLYGADAGVGLPAGFHLSAHYYRHSNEFGRELVDDSFDAYVDMAGNEWGGSLEWHLGLIPGSPVAPFVGAGASYSRVTLDGKVEWEGESATLGTDTDLYRLYGLAGLKLTDALRATVRAGMTFGENEAAKAEYEFQGQTISVSADYQGYYVAGALSLGF